MLLALMSEWDVWHDMKLAKYFAARGKLTKLDARYVEWTALTYASSEGHLDIMEALLAAGADKNKSSRRNGDAPLIHAADVGHVECLKALLSAGADMDKSDDYGYTPLIRASINGHVEIAKLILAAGATKDNIDTGGNTALTLVTE